MRAIMARKIMASWLAGTGPLIRIDGPGGLTAAAMIVSALTAAAHRGCRPVAAGGICQYLDTGDVPVRLRTYCPHGRLPWRKKRLGVGEGAAMPTTQATHMIVRNFTGSTVDIFVAHRADSSVPLRLRTGATLNYGTQYQYPVSTAYYMTDVSPVLGLPIYLDYEAGPGAGMDYWYVAVNIHGGSAPGAYSVGGTALFPNNNVKIPDPPEILYLSVSQDQVTPGPPTFSVTEVDIPGGGQQGGMTIMKADKTFSPWPIKRKNVAALTSAERASYVQAVKGLKKAPSQMSPATHSRYDDYVLVHMLSMNEIDHTAGTPVQNGNIHISEILRSPMWAHQGPQFLAWHREFLRQFERDLQGQLSQNPVQDGYLFGIPFWDWSVNSGDGEAPWLDDFLGSNGTNGPVMTGPFAGNGNWPITLSNDLDDHLIRAFGTYTGTGPSAWTASHLPTAGDVKQTLDEDVFDVPPWTPYGTDGKMAKSFRNQLEGFYLPASAPGPPAPQVGMHNLVHCWVAGNNGTMNPASSPNDPVFFLHHSNIDRLWAVWQRKHPRAAPYLPATPSGDALDLNKQMTFTQVPTPSNPQAPTFSNPWTDPAATPAQVVSHLALNYFFEDTEVY